MIQLDASALRRLQLTELELLTEVDRICRKRGIHYNIIAGTLLGAVRHGGFIPWDDDADVAMLRSEYERFREACQQELDTEKYCFQDHTCTPGYRWGYGKLRRRDTLFLREHQEHMPYEQGVFIDIFPLDAVSDSPLGRAAENFGCFLLRKCLWARVGRYASPVPAERRLYALLDAIPEKTLLSALDRKIRRCARRDTQWVRILMFPTPNRQYGYKKKWYVGEKTILFEGQAFPGITEAEEYLRFKYGDYTVLPPPEKRKVHPVSAIRLPETTE